MGTQPRLVALLVLAVLISSRTALALDLGLYGTYWNPDDGRRTWGFGTKAATPLMSDHFKLEGRASWYPKDRQGRIGDVRFVPLDLGLAAHMFPREPLDIFAAGGVSYIFASGSDVSIKDSWGAYLGAGAEFALMENVSLLSEVLVRFAEFDLRHQRDSSFDATGLNLNLGLMLRF